MIGENLVKEFEANYKWTIVRPTSIWGPWFGRTYRDFFEMIIRGTYFNFSGKMCTKTYGYIGNIVYQIDKILNSDMSNSKTLYVGDYEPIKINEWAIEISKKVNSKVYTVPFFIIKIAALLGNGLNYINIGFPITTFRLKNMTTDNILDLSETRKIAPDTQFSREKGIELTIDWMKKIYNPSLFS